MSAAAPDELDAMVDSINTATDPTFDNRAGESRTPEQIYGDIERVVEAMKSPPSQPLTEQQKYETMWSREEYRRVSPGEQIAQEFLQIARIRNGAHIIDFGAGTGRGSMMVAILANMAGLDVELDMLDFAANSLDPEVADLCKQDGKTKLRFTQHDLSKPAPLAAEYGYCCDVMEHIPPEQVDKVLTNILQAARHVFFQISCVDDACGVLIGHPLHLSVHEPAWWKKKLEDLGCHIHYWEDREESCVAYVTAWSDGQDIVDVGVLNIEEEKIRANVRTNLAARFYTDDKPSDAIKAELFRMLCENGEWRKVAEHATTHSGEHFDASMIREVHLEPRYAKVGFAQGRHEDFWLPVEPAKMREALRQAGVELDDRWLQVRPHQTQSTEVMILGGGPSLAGQLDTIRRMRFEGKKLVTLNGAYNWAIENGFEVSAQIIVDARPFNARFTKPVQPQTIYLIGSQCDPSVLEGLPKERTLLWHTTAEAIKDILEEECSGQWFGVPGGSTVLLRAIPLLRMLGYSRFHLFGCDSCVAPKKVLKRKSDGELQRYGHGTGREAGVLYYDTTEKAEAARVYLANDYGVETEVVDDDQQHHHAYSQPENDGVPIIPVTVGGRVFRCTAWQAAQATEFMTLIAKMGDMFELQVHGGGLLAWILQHGAQVDIDMEEAREGSEK